ncbi:MAG: hypothetical protein GX620_05045 [Chloroflexi bacterium]|nr:hypothetical protein [Chloroflexota bacterium]
MRRDVLAVVLLFAAVLSLTACGSKPLLSNVSFSSDVITPNADHDRDVVLITYDLSRSAWVSVYFDDSNGVRYFFRDRIRHGPSVDEPYQFYFAGVVDGYTRPDEHFDGFSVEKRVLQDGDYTWTIEAVDIDGSIEQTTGTLRVEDADTSLPELRGFSIFPPVFSPNRDGIDDRATINVDLKKDVDELIVFLEGDDGIQYPIEENERATPINTAGWHAFDYDAGVDLGADPPPDGAYLVTMRARDAIGQWTVATGTLTIENGGVPRAYILNAEVEWSTGTVALNSTLYFTLTIDNDSATAIRTSGPPPGTVYRSDQNYATLGEYEQSGAFRVGIHCETSPTDHPWRWALGSPDDLLSDDAGHWYLPAWSRSVVTGGIQFVDVVEARNPQYCYASLIHEDVEISMVNYRVDPVHLRIQTP